MKTHPQAIGSYWYGKKDVHGPRINNPAKFKKMYTVSQRFAKKRYPGVIKKEWTLPPSTKLVAGPLKSNNQFAVQSFVTPIRSWKYVAIRPYKRVGRRVRGHTRRVRRFEKIIAQVRTRYPEQSLYTISRTNKIIKSREEESPILFNKLRYKDTLRGIDTTLLRSQDEVHLAKYLDKHPEDKEIAKRIKFATIHKPALRGAYGFVKGKGAVIGLNSSSTILPGVTLRHELQHARDDPPQAIRALSPGAIQVLEDRARIRSAELIKTPDDRDIFLFDKRHFISSKEGGDKTWQKVKKIV